MTLTPYLIPHKMIISSLLMKEYAASQLLPWFLLPHSLHEPCHHFFVRVTPSLKHSTVASRMTPSPDIASPLAKNDPLVLA
jgi:hypothetical protein